MENFIQIPMEFKEFDVNKRLNVICLYAMMRSYIKDNSCKVTISQEKLSRRFNVSVDTIQRYIEKLYEAGYIKDINKIPTNNGYFYNVYTFKKYDKFGIVLSSIFNAPDLTTEDIGLLILLKINCNYGTNIIEFNSMTDLAKKIGLSRNIIKEKIDRLNNKYLQVRGKWLNLSQKFFPLYLKLSSPKFDRDIEMKKAYIDIYNYCVINNVIPPYKKCSGYRNIDLDLEYIYENSQGYNNLIGAAALRAKLYDRIDLTNKDIERITFDYIKAAFATLKKENKEQPDKQIIIL